MIELPKDAQKQAVASIERYCREHLGDVIEQPLGNVAAAGLLDFFLREIGPSVYNQGVAHAQARLVMRAGEIDIEVHEAEFDFWHSAGKGRRGR